MKIHESMNVLLHKKLHFLLFFAGVFWLGFGQLSAQNTPTMDVYEVTVLMNETYEFDVIKHFSISAYDIEIKKTPENGTAFFDPYTSNPNKWGVGAPGGLNPGLNYLHYTPAPGFLGYDEIVVRYHQQFGSWNSEPAFNIYKIKVVPSYLFAENDYAATDEGQAVTVNVLDNDYGNGTNLVVSEITNVNNGTATLTNGGTQIEFTPAAGFSGVGHLNYTICDAQGSCDVATVSICVNALNPVAYDSIHVTTEKNGEQVILMELNNDYTVTTSPTLGSVDTFETLTYVPSADQIGTDKVVFTDAANNRVRVFEIEILDVATENTLLNDDIRFTPQGEAIEAIHLLDNDNGGQFLTSVSAIGGSSAPEHGTLTPLPSLGKGVYRYIPDASFTGVDYFRYKANAPGSSYSETATCYIVVGNQNPELPIFHVSSPKNTPLVLGDHLPFHNYEYLEVPAAMPGQGSLAFYAGENTVTSQHGQTFTGNNMLVYDPNPGATGTDEFEVDYCAGSQAPCVRVKVIVDVMDVAAPQNPMLCAGPACVWPGDTDRNGKVDVRDILPIGLCMGEVGGGRQNGSIDWYGQYADNWNSLQARALPFDVKHIDTDGNGIVSAMDTAAIGQFYGKYSNLTPSPSAPISPLPFYIDTEPLIQIAPSAVIYAPIHLGNDSIPAFDAYGLTFEIEYDPALFAEVNVHWNNTAWLQYNSPVLSKIVKPFAGKLDAGYTRTDGAATSGYGIIGTAEFIVIDDVLGNRLNNLQTTVNFKSAGLLNGSGESYGLSDNSITFVLSAEDDGKEKTATENDLQVFPNPAQNNVTVHLNGLDQEMERIALYDVMGKSVYDSGSILAKHQRLDVSQLATGIYIIKVWTNGEMLNKKVEVVR